MYIYIYIIIIIIIIIIMFIISMLIHKVACAYMQYFIV